VWACYEAGPTGYGLARAASSRLTMLDVHEIGPHYAETLQRWCANVHEHIDEICAPRLRPNLRAGVVDRRYWDGREEENSSPVVILSVVDQSSGSYASTGCEK
jgi:hypothetical protein